jgi:hypothetical protein
MLTVLATGPLSTVQDRGRPGYAGIGVPRSGAADAPAAELANRLVGNDHGAAVVEVTAGGLRLRAERTVLVTVTGAPAPITVNGRPAPFGGPLTPSGCRRSACAPTSRCGAASTSRRCSGRAAPTRSRASGRDR